MSDKENENESRVSTALKGMDENAGSQKIYNLHLKNVLTEFSFQLKGNINKSNFKEVHKEQHLSSMKKAGIFVIAMGSFVKAFALIEEFLKGLVN